MIETEIENHLKISNTKLNKNIKKYANNIITPKNYYIIKTI
jgi:hypothetical protein